MIPFLTLFTMNIAFQKYKEHREKEINESLKKSDDYETAGGEDNEEEEEEKKVTESSQGEEVVEDEHKNKH